MMNAEVTIVFLFIAHRSPYQRFLSSGRFEHPASQLGVSCAEHTTHPAKGKRSPL
jgi:hypothetical protein